jgi:hypothetical protein
MDELAGLQGTYHDGVFFTEAEAPANRIADKPVTVRIPGQNANLTQLKTALARQVSRSGGNALVGFTYGQKSNFLGWDASAWRGSGFVARP